MANGSASVLNKELVRGAGAVLNVAFVIVLALLSYVGRGISDQLQEQTAIIASVDRRVTTIEANRFTTRDGVRAQEEIARLWKEFSLYSTRDELLRLENRVERLERYRHRDPSPQAFPPPDD